MKLNRLEELYRRPLKPAELAKKQLPLEYILKKELDFFPKKPEKFDYHILEIGPGTGDFLFHLAEKHPDKKILGIEIGKKRFEKIQVRLKKRNIENVSLIHGDLATWRWRNEFEIIPCSRSYTPQVYGCRSW